MRASIERAKSRARSPLGGARARQQFPSVKNMQLNNLSVPTSVQAGESFTAEANISNGATWRGFTDPDRCDSAANTCTTRACIGCTCVEAVFEMDGETIVDGPFSHCGAEIGANTVTYEVVFEAPPTNGTYEVSVLLRLPGSGETAGPLTQQITVTGEDPKDPEPPNGDNGDNGGGNGDNGGVDLDIGLIIMVFLVVVGGAIAVSQFQGK